MLGRALDEPQRVFCALAIDPDRRHQLRIPTMPISRSCGSRSVIPIDPDHGGVGA